MICEYEVRDNHLLVTVTGAFDFDEAVASIPEGFRWCIEHELDQVLVDLRELQGESSMIGRFFYLDKLGSLHEAYAKFGYPPLRVVFVGSDQFVSTGDYEESVAGLYNLEPTTTSDMAEALRWLGISGTTCRRR